MTFALLSRLARLSGFLSVVILSALLIGALSFAVAQSGERQSLTIYTSDPRDVILEVYVNEEFRPVLSRSGNSVNVELTDRPAPGTDVDCRVILEVVLASRDRRKQPVDLCAANFQVTFSSGGIGGAVAASTSPPTQSSPAPTQSPSDQAQTSPTAPTSLAPIAGDDVISATTPVGGETLGNLPASPPTVAPAVPISSPATFRWSFAANLTEATLVHGLEDRPDFDFSARCQLQTGLIEIALPLSATATNGQSPLVMLTAGSFAQSYSGRSELSTNSAAGNTEISVMRFQVSSVDPFWQAIIQERELQASSFDGDRLIISLSGSAGPTRSFVASCGQGATVPPVAGGLANDLTGWDRYSCADLGTIRTPVGGQGLGSGQTVSLRISNDGFEPILIYWIDYEGRQKLYTTLEAGDRYDQPSFPGHPWLVTRALDGYCLGIYVADQNYNEVVISTVGGSMVPLPASPNGPSPLGPLPPNTVQAPPGSLRTPQPIRPTGPMAPTVPIQPNRTNQASSAASFTYSCDDGRTLRVTFDRRQNSATISDGLTADVVLFPARTNSGFRYSDQVRELNGRGQRIFWNDGRRVTVCFER